MESQLLDLRGLLGILKRQWGLIGIVFVATLAAALLVLLTQKPSYTASALILVDTSQKDLLTAADARQPDQSATASPRVESEVRLVKSPATLRGAIDALELTTDPQFTPQLGIADRLRMALHLGNPGLPSGQQALNDVMDKVDAAVSVSRVEDTFLIEVTARTSDAELSAKLANQVADGYIADQRQVKIDSVLASGRIIASRLGDANAAVVESEEAIDKFIDSNFDVISQSTGKADLTAIRGRLQQVQQEQAGLSARADKLAKGLASADWKNATATLQSDSASALETQREDLERGLSGVRGGDASATTDLRSQLTNIEEQLTDTVQQGLAGLKSQIASDQSQTADLRSQMRDATISSGMPTTLMTELYSLQQNAQIARSQLQTLIARQKDLETQAFLQVADSRLASPATPPTSPSSPNARLVLVLGGLAGLALGMGIALLRETLVGGFTSLGQVEAVLHMPAIAALPWQRQPRDAALKPATIADMMHVAPISGYSEAVRMVQVGVDQAIRRMRRGAANSADVPAAGGTVVLLTSAHAGEGKTTIALSLARAFVASGRSTLLIDGDLRAPRLHQHLRLEPSAGLVDYLAKPNGGLGVDEIVVSDPLSELRVIVGAHRSDMPTDRLINNEALASLVMAARRHFEIIIVDSPPITEVVDALYLAEHADIGVFVLKWASTSQLAARNAAVSLRESLAPGTEIIAIMNQQRRRGRPGAHIYRDV